MSSPLGRTSFVLLVAVVLGVWLSACSDGDDQTAAGGPGLTVPPASEAADPPTPGFDDTSGQTNIPAFGVEARGADRAAVEATLNAYLASAGAGEWSRACSYLDGSIAGEVANFSRGSNRGGGDGCATALPRILKLAERYQDPYFGSARLSGLRVKEGAGAGFALFHGEDGNDYWAAVKVENGRWKILSTLPTRLTE
ncbi:MAG TPA: hypothetical protein VFX85_07180 [Solirubrobacterales bacterium]|nr:hypothetical protein [Solirubrobacterales bacterium]